MNATPLTNDEIKDLLTSTLHGPLHKDTMNRVFASLVALMSAREVIKKLQESPKREKDDPNTEAVFWLNEFQKLWTEVYVKCFDPDAEATYGDICDRAVRMANAACKRVYKINNPEPEPA